MFGYVKVYQPELKLRELEHYRGVYCSLCRTLGERYGLAARMTLSYDFTFLALFHIALHDQALSFRQGTCPFHPLKKRLLCEGDATRSLEYAADVAMLLVYHKLTDTIQDAGFLTSLGARFLRFFVARDFRKASKHRPLEAEAAQRYMNKQAIVETAREASIDAAAEPTAEFLQTLAVSELPDGVDEHVVRRFGYCLGRFIYLADAADDLEHDLKSGDYNPYILHASLEAADDKALAQTKKYASESLHACAAVCAECYEQLSVKRFDGILRNVIYYGMPSVIRQIQNGKREGKRHEKSV